MVVVAAEARGCCCCWTALGLGAAAGRGCWFLRRDVGGAKVADGLRRVGGAILVALDQTEAVGLSSSPAAEVGGGRSPYNPPSIFDKAGAAPAAGIMSIRPESEERGR